MTQPQVRRLTRSSAVSRASICCLLAGLAIGTSGCERAESSYAQEISEARDMMLVMTAATENRESEIQAVIGKLNSAMGDVEGDAKAPAQLMLARANSALAEIQMREARGLSSEISLNLTRADAIAREYSSNRAFAMTLVGPDATAAVRNIEAQVREIDAEIRELESQKQQLDGELAEVQSEIQQLMESARAERLQEADLRDESLDAQPMRRAELIEQAVRRARSAEAYERTAAERELTVNSLQVAIARVEDIISNQQLLRAIQTEGLERISRVDREITDRRASREGVTQESLASYSQQLDAVIAMYRGEFSESVEAAATGFAGAASTARQARSMGGLASSAAGEHSAASARAHEMRALTAQRIASSASYTADVVALGGGNASSFEGIAQEFAQEAEQAFAAAAEAYSESASSFAGAGADMSRVLSERYEARARELRGEPDPQDGDMGGDGMDDGMNG